MDSDNSERRRGTVRAFVQPMAVGEVLIDMPLYLEPSGYVLVPLESTYTRALQAMPNAVAM